MWTNDSTISFSCYSPKRTLVQRCSCRTYQVYHSKYHNSTMPSQVEFLSGVYSRVETREEQKGLLAPLYKEKTKKNFLFSHHPQGLVWQVSSKLTTTPLRGVAPGPSCPDDADVTWELYQRDSRKFIEDSNILITCIDRGWDGK